MLKREEDSIEKPGSRSLLLLLLLHALPCHDTHDLRGSLTSYLEGRKIKREERKSKVRHVNVDKQAGV